MLTWLDQSNQKLFLWRSQSSEQTTLLRTSTKTTLSLLKATKRELGQCFRSKQKRTYEKPCRKFDRGKSLSLPRKKPLEKWLLLLQKDKKVPSTYVYWTTTMGVFLSFNSEWCESRKVATVDYCVWTSFLKNLFCVALVLALTSSSSSSSFPTWLDLTWFDCPVTKVAFKLEKREEGKVLTMLH